MIYTWLLKLQEDKINHNGKVEWPNITFKNMVQYQLISCGHDNIFRWFWYQYTVYLVLHIINLRIGTVPIILWLKLIQNNVLVNYHMITQILCCQLKIWKDVPWPSGLLNITAYFLSLWVLTIFLIKMIVILCVIQNPQRSCIIIIHTNIHLK